MSFFFLSPSYVSTGIKNRIVVLKKKKEKAHVNDLKFEVVPAKGRIMAWIWWFSILSEQGLLKQITH